MTTPKEALKPLDVMIDAGLLFDDEHEAARALLETHEIRRK